MMTLFENTSFHPLDKKMNAQYRPSEETIIPQILGQVDLSIEQRHQIQEQAKKLVDSVRSQKIKTLGIENFLQTYDLGSQEGLALMCLAEAYLRVPDSLNKTNLIRDKVGSVEWEQNIGEKNSFVMNLATFGLAATDNLMNWGLDREGFVGALSTLSRKLSEPVIRKAVNQAMKLMGQQFVLGETIQEALKKAQSAERRGYRYSYDMLGEGAKTKVDAHRYFESYANTISIIGQTDLSGGMEDRPSISVKISAIYPRYELLKKEKVLSEVYPKLHMLCLKAKEAGIALTIDAEEVDRLELSLELLEKLCQAEDLADWQGLGLAVQAYQKRADRVIDWLSQKAKQYNRRFYVRLVKGAYWDMEIKRTQELGLSDYPVFTRKVHSDLNYIFCAQKMFQDQTGIYPQFATHNAFTVATILEFSQKYHRNFEFQRLHGMGEFLYEQPELKGFPCRIYAPVGEHKDLLAYLVRRLLENGANNSFVNQIHDKTIPTELLVEDPIEKIAETISQGVSFRNPSIPLPQDLLMPDRLNSKGKDLGDQSVLGYYTQLLSVYPDHFPLQLTSLISGKEDLKGTKVELTDPGYGESVISKVIMAEDEDVVWALDSAEQGIHSWSQTSVDHRAGLIERLADQMEKEQDTLLALLTYEGGKTIADGISEIREAVDFCRYYAHHAREMMRMPIPLPGPTGELNELSYGGRGIFVCISPWNFPLAIFLGQVVAALVTGNVVIAKPAQQTPAIAHHLVRMAYQIGIPKDVLQLLLAKGSQIGKILLTDSRVAGVAFTGSTEVAWTINQTLASRKSTISPLIAETGGINAMIVDSSALPEQVVRDVVISAFQSAGQRCSALRLLFVQEDVLKSILEMLEGAMLELDVGYTAKLSEDIGPVIDKASYNELKKYSEFLGSLGEDRAKLLAKVPLKQSCKEMKGNYFSPQAWILASSEDVTREVFGPILHIVPFKGDELPLLVQQINSKKFGLTLGLHSRIDETIAYVRQHAKVGNFYVNRSMIGAVVGVQPFGGEGLSGTGPKAGGPNYLHRFVVERTYTQDTTAAGGNASLLASI